ncbi:putative SOS response-associated peptidase YedK [Sphingomonas sp. SORGH_AS 950]|nr:SOS response-associated peptidase family protein [Sphingomonas sp. SORGH_AS_0950]MDQ1158908.1 putative SOS response-associated peptidase YedK [Sphingomonas sp. SORGH_AS_0950]
MNPARRCLVPVTRFQERSATPDPVSGKKRPFWFSLPSAPIFAFAGIWRPAEGGAVYAFLTSGYCDSGNPDDETAAAAAHVVGRVHPKACPVILHPENYDTWLQAGTTTTILRPSSD